MSPVDFSTAAKGTTLITGTDAVTGTFAGFYAPEGGAVIASITVDDKVYADPADYFGSATVLASTLLTIGGYTNEIYCSSITLTSGSLVAIKA